MEEAKTTQPSLGTWDKLPTEQVDKKPKVSFDVNIPVEVQFMEDSPKEYQGDTGAYYVFQVKQAFEQKVIMTSSWTLLRALKCLVPLKGKKVKITKKLVKGKQTFEVTQL